MYRLAALLLALIFGATGGVGAALAHTGCGVAALPLMRDTGKLQDNQEELGSLSIGRPSPETRSRQSDVANILGIMQEGLEALRSCEQPSLRKAATSAPTIVALASPEHVPGEVFRDCQDCPEMVVVPQGEFEMGSNDTAFEKPIHRVALAKPFAIGRREVTFAEWDLCFSSGGCKFTPNDHGFGRGDRPVIDISWEDAKSFVAWLSQKTGKAYRLPTEAEWEYAARAGTTSAYWWGRDVGSNHANCDGCGGGPPHQTTPTGSFRPNAFGLYDTAGNAAEWVEDCWNESYRGAPRDGSAWTTGNCGLRVLRGGSFGNRPDAVRSAARFRYDNDVRYYWNGFRVARDVE